LASCPLLEFFREGLRQSGYVEGQNVAFEYRGASGDYGRLPALATELIEHRVQVIDYDTADFVAGCRERGCTPHVSQNDTNRRSAIDARTTRHPGYRISTIKRKRIEEPFGWMKTVGGLRKTRHRGRGLVEWFFVLTATAYNLIRMRGGGLSPLPWAAGSQRFFDGAPFLGGVFLRCAFSGRVAVGRLLLQRR
jgi:hypothetical protein